MQSHDSSSFAHMVALSNSNSIYKARSKYQDDLKSNNINEEEDMQGIDEDKAEPEGEENDDEVNALPENHGETNETAGLDEESGVMEGNLEGDDDAISEEEEEAEAETEAEAVGEDSGAEENDDADSE